MYKHQGSGRRWTDEELLSEMRRAARELGTFPALAATAVEEHIGITRNTVRKRFDSWERACQLAGLQAPHRLSARHAPLGALFTNLQMVHKALGHTPRVRD